jgi:hypothetical protein
MPYYWLAATLKFGFWMVDTSSQERFSTVQEAIDNGLKRTINDDNESILTQYGRLLLIGKLPPKTILTKQHRWRWILVTDPYNKPGYIVKMSTNFYNSLLECWRDVTNNLTVPTNCIALNDCVVMFRKF